MRNKATRATFFTEVHQTTITGLSHDGRGIASHSDGKTTFITGALPGETVNYSLSKIHPRYNEGTATDITLPSPDRTTPGCADFSICGGCSLQHMTMAAQIQLKQNVLLEQLSHFGHVEPEHVLLPVSSATWGYRRKARLGVRFVIKKGKMFIGFREKASRYLADISACEVLHPSVGHKLPDIAAALVQLSQYKQIPQIEVAIGDDATALVIRHLTPLTDEDKASLVTFAQTHHYHMYLQPNLPDPLTKLWPADNDHRLSYQLKDYALTFAFHPLDFTQVNGDTNPLLVRQALELLAPQPTDRILDLFCGLGNFTLPIARSAGHVVGVEGSVEMVTRATANADSNHIQNTAFYAANLAEDFANKPTWLKQQYDKVLIDPPRTGAKEMLAHIAATGAKRIVYVSCNPATLARDAGELVHQHGYRLKQVGVINMFPHTSHIEAIALFEK